MASWEDVDVLMKQFQAVQKSSTKQKLSERNVIELVSKLIDLRLIEVVYTVDGKEYLTQDEIVKEIKEELFVHGGRIALTDLAQILNLDFSHIEARTHEVMKSDKSIYLVLGNLISKRYLDSLAEEVNDKLQEKGHVTISDLTKVYDLPADFLTSSLQSRIGSIIKGQIDSYDRNVIYTNAFILRIRGQIRGAFSAVTRPVLLQSVLQRYNFHERIFYTVLEELLKLKRLPGTVNGMRQEKGVYVPDIYAKSQNEWVDNFYKQNGYLEYDSLVRQGISDPKPFIKKRFKSEPLVFLSSCCAGQLIQDNLEAYVEDALSSGSWMDVMPFLPSVFSTNDANQLLNQCLKKHPDAIVCCETIVASQKIIAEVSKPFPDLMAVKAEKDAKTHPAFRFTGADQGKAASGGGGNTKEDRKDQRKKKAAAGQKSGGGTQGREVKTKSLKKKGGRAARDDDSDDESTTTASKSRTTEIEFMSAEEIEDVIRKDQALEECPEELIQEIAQQLYRPLTKQYQEIAKSVFLQTAGAAGTSRKKTHDQLQDKVTGLWNNAKLFEKGLKLLTEDTQAALIRHLLRTVCTDMTNLVLTAVATDYMVTMEEDTQQTTESRAKIISKLPGEVMRLMTSLNTSLNGKVLDDFFKHFEVICGNAHLGILLRKLEKKKEKQVVFNHRAMLSNQLQEETDAAMTLHLATVILFQKFTLSMIHLPGKCVPNVLIFLRDHMEKESFEELTLLQANIILQTEREAASKSGRFCMQSVIEVVKERKYSMLGNLRDLVIAQLQKQQQQQSEKEDVEAEETIDMSPSIEKVKNIALTTKKSVQAAAAAATED